VWKLKFDIKINPMLWIVALLIIALSCTNDNGPTAPNVIPDPVPVESNIFTGFESDYYRADTDSISYIALIERYTNMDSVVKALPIVGLAVYDDNIDLFGIYFGSFYERVDYNNAPDMERISGRLGPYSALWVWVGMPYADIDTVQYSLYPLPFVAYGDVTVEEVEKRVEKYFDNIVRAPKALGKRQTIKELGGRTNSTVF
jgi:hypothetical protein